MSSNERVYIVTESELEELIAHKQTEALKTIYSIAKSNPNASWNELVVRSAEQLQNPDSVPEQPAEPETVAEVEDPQVVEEEDILFEAEEDVLDMSDETEDSLLEDSDDIDEDESDEEADNIEEDEPVEAEEDSDDIDEDDDEDMFEEPAPTTGVTPLSSFRNNDSRMIREASIFDD